MVLSEPFLSDITQINFNIVAMVCGRGLPIEVSNHQFSLPAVFVEIWPFRATSFRRFARPVGRFTCRVRHVSLPESPVTL